MEVKALTEAQMQHLLELDRAAALARIPLDSFIAYLRKAHDAPEGEYVLPDARGFVRVQADPPAETKTK